MDSKEYIHTQNKILELGSLASAFQLNLGGFIRMIDHAQAVAPMIDPTLCQRAHNNLSAIKKMAETLQPFVVATSNARDTLLATWIQENQNGCD